MKHKYSGKRSTKFWKEIDKIEDQKLWDLIYKAGCELQELEARVLTQLKLLKQGKCKF